MRVSSWATRTVTIALVGLCTVDKVLPNMVPHDFCDRAQAVKNGSTLIEDGLRGATVRVVIGGDDFAIHCLDPGETLDSPTRDRTTPRMFPAGSDRQWCACKRVCIGPHVKARACTPCVRRFVPYASMHVRERVTQRRVHLLGMVPTR